jgi:hypothetical protein
MTQGDAVPVFEDGRPADFLVDFHAKKRELEQRQTEQFSTSSAAAKPPSSLSKIVDLDDTYDSNPLIVHYDHSEEKVSFFKNTWKTCYKIFYYMVIFPFIIGSGVWCLPRGASIAERRCPATEN